MRCAAGSEAAFLDNVKAKFAAAPHAFFELPHAKVSRTAFSVVHYADKITYCCNMMQRCATGCTDAAWQRRTPLSARCHCRTMQHRRMLHVASQVRGGRFPQEEQGPVLRRHQGLPQSLGAAIRCHADHHRFRQGIPGSPRSASVSCGLPTSAAPVPSHRAARDLMRSSLSTDCLGAPRQQCATRCTHRACGIAAHGFTASLLAARTHRPTSLRRRSVSADVRVSPGRCPRRPPRSRAQPSRLRARAPARSRHPPPTQRGRAARPLRWPRLPRRARAPARSQAGAARRRRACLPWRCAVARSHTKAAVRCRASVAAAASEASSRAASDKGRGGFRVCVRRRCTKGLAFSRRTPLRRSSCSSPTSSAPQRRTTFGASSQTRRR